MIDEEMNSEQEDPHRSPSPPRTAERLFGIGTVFETRNISATLLAEHIRNSDRLSSVGYISSKTSLATDEYHSVSSNPVINLFSSHQAPVIVTPPTDIIATTFISKTLSDDYSSDDDFPAPSTSDKGLQFDLNNYILSQTIAEELESRADSRNPDGASDISETIEFETTQYNGFGTAEHCRTPELIDEVDFPDMSVEANPTVSELGVPDEQPMHVDAAEKIYDTAKDVWSWGKGIIFVSPFLGVAEGIASNVVRITTGESLDSVDRNVTDHIQGLDDKILNPAISFLVQALLKAAGKTEDVMKPIIIKILTPFGLIKTTAENPEITTVAGVTVTHE